MEEEVSWFGRCFLQQELGLLYRYMAEWMQMSIRISFSNMQFLPCKHLPSSLLFSCKTILPSRAHRPLNPFVIFYPFYFLFCSVRVQCRKIKLLTKEPSNPRCLFGCWVSVSSRCECVMVSGNQHFLPLQCYQGLERLNLTKPFIFEFNSAEYILDLQDSHQVHWWQHNQNSQRMQVIWSHTVCCLQCVLHRFENKSPSDEIKYIA